ncbi:MAG: dihydropteroate synthase [Syntrophaceae bacterium]|nr:dihydropteroate synthase [Syntrophaceae bacterium]
MVQSKDKEFHIRILSSLSEDQTREVLKAVRVDHYAIDILMPKMRHLNILLKDIECKVANIIKQEMLAVGGDAAVARGTVACSISATDVMLMGTEKQIKQFLIHITAQPFGLKSLSHQLEDQLTNYFAKEPVLFTNRRELNLTGRTHIMGIINVTPDSFSDGGQYYSTQSAIDQARKLEAEGADFLDVGGESSRPGSDFVSLQEEMDRVIPVLKGLAGKVKIPISVDTIKSEVAEAAIAEGAEIINDISAMTFDARMASVIAKNKAAVVLMHMRGLPKTMQEGPIIYGDLMGSIIGYLAQQIKMARTGGIRSESIILDPGIGFGKTVDNNLKIINCLSELKIFGMPILTGVSRKSFTGTITGTTIPAERSEGTAAAITATILNGSHIVRVHDVAAAKKIAAMADAIIRN